MLHPRRVERRAPASLVVLSQLEVEALAVHADGNVSHTDQESSQVRSAWSARSYEGIEHPAKPSAAMRSRPR